MRIRVGPHRRDGDDIAGTLVVECSRCGVLSGCFPEPTTMAPAVTFGRDRADDHAWLHHPGDRVTVVVEIR